MRLVIALGLLLPTTLVAQTGGEPVPPSATLRGEIVALEQQIGDANFTCDYGLFARVEAAEFLFTDASGGVTTRAQDLAGEISCRPKQGSYSVDEVRLHRYGDVVVFNARATIRTTDRQGRPVTRTHRFTDVLVWRDRRWQLVSGQASH
jgi:hypothetical protein